MGTHSSRSLGGIMCEFYNEIACVGGICNMIINFDFRVGPRDIDILTDYVQVHNPLQVELSGRIKIIQ